MFLVELTSVERSIIQALLENRLAEWQQVEIFGPESKKKFAASYIKPLHAALNKLKNGDPNLYSPIEKAILEGCLRERLNQIKDKSSNELTDIISICNSLLDKIQICVRQS